MGDARCDEADETNFPLRIVHDQLPSVFGGERSTGRGRLWDKCSVVGSQSCYYV